MTGQGHCNCKRYFYWKILKSMGNIQRGTKVRPWPLWPARKTQACDSHFSSRFLSIEDTSPLSSTPLPLLHPRHLGCTSVKSLLHPTSSPLLNRATSSHSRRTRLSPKTASKTQRATLAFLAVKIFSVVHIGPGSTLQCILFKMCQAERFLINA